MSATTGADTGTHRADRRSSEARSLHWLLGDLVREVPAIHSVAVVSSDGLLLLSSDTAGGPDGEADAGQDAVAGPSRRSPRGSGADLATIVSGLASLTVGAAHLMDGGQVRQTMVAMEHCTVLVMAISDGSLLGVRAAADCDLGEVAYHMALFVGRAGHVLTPGLRSELRASLEPDGQRTAAPAASAGARPKLARREVR
ncbi:roadblock/LC7 domain-containing protein [Streptomyces sp. MUM 203J]|uniref:roadblock/LC7 domain-containing protein n=1 Tax=Streptomyces sp. MUM 203J TaxID=2791990 RepID=UPI001F0398A9|nr:roadblock/LC7 domain-containing protein [Streptomyces sp. MUM 203J]MCH0538220.1 roadblock/LC7 domain-containing protein [Streptomyces sp. MUM 203J]